MHRSALRPRLEALSRAPYYALYLACLAALLFLLRPRLSFPGDGIDASWLEGMNQVVARKLSFGRDVAFTYGPFSRIHTSQYHPRLFATHCFLLAFLAVLHVSLLHRLVTLSFTNRVARAVLLALLVPLIGTVDVSWYLLPPLGFLVFIVHERPRDQLFHVFFWCGMAVLFLTKSSNGLSTLLLWGFSLGWCLLERRFRWPLVAYPLSVLLLWVIERQALLAFPSFLTNTFQIGSGYGEAMGRPLKTLALIPAFWFALGLAASLLFACQKKGRPRLIERGALPLGYLLLGVSLFKGTFVAGYLDTAMVTALAMCAFIWIANWSEIRTRALRVTFGVSVLASLAATQLMSSAYFSRNVVSYLAGQASSVAQLALGNFQQLHAGKLVEAYEDGEASIRQKYRVRALKGNTDVYRTSQGIAFAYGMDWNPRPVLQSYSAYTPALIERNRQHLLGSRRPDNLIVELLTIDRRYPMLDDGISLLEILSRYRVTQLPGEVAVFQHRPQVIPYEFVGQQELTAHFNRRLAVPNALGGLQFVWIKFQKTLPGRLASTLYRSPIVGFEVFFANGRHRRFRVNASMTETGFLLSPFIRNVEQYALLNDAHAQRAPKPNWVVGVKFDVEPGFDWMYEDAIAVRLARVQFASRDQAEGFAPSEIEKISRRAWSRR